jgi:hypothetical protein
LAIVAALADEWGFRSLLTRQGKVVWFSLALN